MEGEYRETPKKNLGIDRVKPLIRKIIIVLKGG
jgi:hypothetical protein